MTRNILAGTYSWADKTPVDRRERVPHPVCRRHAHRLKDGQRITVDGAEGIVRIEG